MQSQPVLRVLFLVGIVIATAGCSKNEALPDTPPIIQFISITKSTLGTGNTKRDSVVITIGYKDGDGNLGESDTTRIKQIFSKQSWGNYQVYALQFVNDKFSELPIVTNSKLFFVYLGRQNKPVSGVIAFSQRFAYETNFKLTPVKFQIKIRDQNLNESSVIETDTISIPTAR
jgi:hypothetical protein